MDDIVFFQILEERLKGQNLSALSRRLKIPKTLIHDWKGGKRLPSLKNLKYVKVLADYLDLELDEIFFGPRANRKEKTIGSVFFSDQEREYLVQIKRVK